MEHERDYTSIENTIHQSLDTIAVPKDHIQAKVYDGFRQVKQEKKRRSLRMTWQIASAICLIIIVFLGSIRLSPAFASTIAQIPWLSQLVSGVQQDKGIQDIIEQEYYEELNISKTIGDLTFTLDGVIADETGLIIFYTIKAPYDISEIRLSKADILLNGAGISAGIGYGWSSGEESSIISNKIVIDTDTSIEFTNAQFELKAEFEHMDTTAFAIPFTLKQPIAETKVYSINQAVEIDGQKLIIDEVRVSPLRAQIDIFAADSNTMQILNVNQLELTDETGEVWGNGNGALIGRGIMREGKMTYYKESNYFRSPQSLTLRIGNIEALPKGRDYIEVDFDKQQIVYQPEEIDLSFNIVKGSISYFIPEHMRRQVLSWGIDAEGKEVYLRSGSQTSTDGEGSQITSHYDITDIVNPVRFDIAGYPSYLEGEAEIVIPLQK